MPKGRILCTEDDADTRDPDDPASIVEDATIATPENQDSFRSV